jgi:hypothetical protein
MLKRRLDEIITALFLIGEPERQYVEYDKRIEDHCSLCPRFNEGFPNERIAPPYICPVRGVRCACRPFNAEGIYA